MAQATKRISTRTASKKPDKRVPRKLQGLGFIDATYQRKSATEPNLQRELKMRRGPGDVIDHVALYDAYKAAAEAIKAVINQPRAAGVADFLDEEESYLFAKAWTVAEHLKTIRPTKDYREEFVRTLVDCAFEMGANVEDAASVLRDATNAVER